MNAARTAAAGTPSAPGPARPVAPGAASLSRSLPRAKRAAPPRQAVVAGSLPRATAVPLRQPKAGTRSLPPTTAVPLPASHIKRTPSEARLLDDTRRAALDDVRMYARLVDGMRARCLAAGYVHPLTRRSLLDIQRTQATDQDAEEVGDGGGWGWELDRCAEEGEDGPASPSSDGGCKPSR